MNSALLSTTWQDAVASVDSASRAISGYPTGSPFGSPEEQEFDRIVGQHSIAARRLIATPAPDLYALRTKLGLLMEFGCVEQDELRAIAADVDRLVAASAEFDPAHWLTEFEAVGGGFVNRGSEVTFLAPKAGESGCAMSYIQELEQHPDWRAAVVDLIHQRDRSTISEEEGGN